MMSAGRSAARAAAGGTTTAAAAARAAVVSTGGAAAGRTATTGGAATGGTTPARRAAAGRAGRIAIAGAAAGGTTTRGTTAARGARGIAITRAAGATRGARIGCGAVTGRAARRVGRGRRAARVRAPDGAIEFGAVDDGTVGRDRDRARRARRNLPRGDILGNAVPGRTRVSTCVVRKDQRETDDEGRAIHDEPPTFRYCTWCAKASWGSPNALHFVFGAVNARDCHEVPRKNENTLCKRAPGVSMHQ